MDQLYKQIQERTHESLAMVDKRMERILGQIEQESLSLALDPVVQEMFHQSDFKKEYMNQKLILDSFSRTKYTLDLIGEIVLYHVPSGLVLSNEYGHISYEDYKFQDDLQLALHSTGPSLWLVLPHASQSGLITFVRKMPILSLAPIKGEILFQIKEEELRGYLQDSFSFVSNYSLLLLDNSQTILQHSKGDERHDSRGNHESAVQAILSSAENSGNFLQKNHSGENTLYTFAKTGMGRVYIVAVPKKELDQSMNWVRWVTLFAVLGLLGVGVLLTYISSRTAYNPVERLMKHSRTLSQGRVPTEDHNELSYIKECLDFLSKESEQVAGYLSRLEPSLRERFLEQLLKGEHSALLNLPAECARYGLSSASSYMVLVADLEQYYRETRFMPEDKPIVSFAISNIMGELLEQHPLLEGYVVNLNQGRGAAILFDYTKSYDRFVDAAKEYATSVCQALEQFMKLKVSVGIGKVYSHVADIPVSYREAQTALQFRLYRETDSVLFIEDLEAVQSKKPVFYPRGEEKAIVFYLTRGDLTEACLALRKFASVLRDSGTYNFIYQSYHVLLSSIIDSLEQQGVSIFDILENNLFDQLKSRQTDAEIYDWFAEVFFPLYLKLTDEQPEETVKMEIHRVCRYIKENIQSDISLTQCSQLIGMSPSYLSRLFKREKGYSFAEFVMMSKLEEAKRLLTETDAQVGDIATHIGYSERNLNRLFNRYLNQTPGQYRSGQR